MPRVFITGLGFITSIGNDAAAVTTSLRELRHGLELYAPFQSQDIPVKVAAPVKGFSTDSTDPEDWTFPAGTVIKREVLRGMSPHVVYAWQADAHASQDTVAMRVSRC
jgi:3-oxoacyl-[acyl-carrier-protein] synthase-1